MYPGSCRVYPERLKLEDKNYISGFDKLISLLRGKRVGDIQLVYEGNPSLYSYLYLSF